jgi:hypothetical protein
VRRHISGHGAALIGFHVEAAWPRGMRALDRGHAPDGAPAQGHASRRRVTPRCGRRRPQRPVDGRRELARADAAGCAPRGGIDGPQVVIVNLHWSDQYIAQPSSFQLALAGTLNCSPDITAIVGRAYRPADPRSQRKLLVFGEGKPDLQPDQRLLSGASQDAMMALLMIMDGRRRVRGATYRASWAAAGTHVSSPRCPAGRLLAARRATRLDGRDVCAYSSPCAVPSPSASASASILARRV